MAFQRKQVGDAERYHGRRLVARYVGPDMTGHVDDIEIASFYLTVESALASCRRYVDAQIKEERKRKE